MQARSRRPTIRDVADRAGVGAMTVSYTFNQPSRVSPQTRERVLEAAAALGYRRPSSVARALRSGRTGQLGVVVGEHLSYALDDPQAAQFFAGVADVCVEQDLGMVLIPTNGARRHGAASRSRSSTPSDVDRVLSAAVDAYVLWTTFADDPVLDAVAESGRPAAIQGGPAREGIAVIGGDDRAAAAAAVRAALDGAEADGGARPYPVIISFPTHPEREPLVGHGSDLPSAVPYPVTASRLEGYASALAAMGFHWEETPVVVTSTNTREDGRAAMIDLLPTTPDDAPLVVIAMSDELALGALEALQDAGRSATLAGWDASPAARAAGIISVENPLREQGRLCARAALGLDDGEPVVSWSIVR